jgi:hypothetical protein
VKHKLRQFASLELNGVRGRGGEYVREIDVANEEAGLPTQMMLNWNPRFKSLRSIWEVMLSKPTWLWGYMVAAGMAAIFALGEDK